MRKNSFFLISTVIAILLCISSCEHRPLVELNEQRYVRIYLDEQLRNVNFGFYDETRERPTYTPPEIMRVAMFNPETGEMVTERYLRDKGSDEKGNYMHGYIYVPQGTYNLVAYNFDTHAINVRDDRWYTYMEAYTEPVSEQTKNKLESLKTKGETDIDEVILKEPEHFFVNNSKGVNAKLSESTDTLKNADGSDFVAKSIVKTYYMQLNVKGVRYVKSAVALITGMAGSARIHDGRLNDESPVSIYFPMKNDVSKMRSNDDTAVAYATFNTFGKLANVEGYINITFEFNTTWGTVQTESIRITDMFETQQVRDNQWIIIDKVIEIVPPDDGESAGGMSPGVGKWDQVEGGITI